MGELTAIVAAFGYSITSTLFTLSGRKIGPIAVNRISMPISLLFLMLAHWLLIGTPVPRNVELQRWLWLSISGMLGMWLAFVLIMYAFVQIGPRLTLLIASVGPIISAVLAWLLLGQTLPAGAVLGMALTIGGIAWVVGEKKEQKSQSATHSFRIGVLFALGAAITQAVSSTLASQGVTGDFEPLTGNLIRLLSATAGIWIVALLQGQSKNSIRLWQANPSIHRQLIIGSISGPVIAASFMLISLQLIPVGVTMTLANLTPIFLLPIGYVVFKEQISGRAILGTCIAVAGTAVLFLSG
ncbi:DMT family transporter [Chloroflexota bacterium]